MSDEGYKEAEHRIEEARRTKATHLNLKGLELRELPDSIGQLIQLKILVLDDNELTQLPDWLGQLI